MRSRTKISYMDSISHSKLDKTKQRNLLKIVQCENILFKLVKKTIEFFLHYWVVQYCTSEKSFRMLQVFAKKNDDARKFIKKQKLSCVYIWFNTSISSDFGFMRVGFVYFISVTLFKIRCQ